MALAIRSHYRAKLAMTDLWTSRVNDVTAALSLVPSGDLPMAVEHLASWARYHKDDTIYHQHGPAAYGYRIITGAARECALMADGRRQVIGFLMPGDIFGLWTRGSHPFSCEAIEETTVARYPRHGIERLVESDADIAGHVHRLTLQAVERLQDRMGLLAKTSALERVSGFLLQMADRSASGARDWIALPMSRYDIADYLVLAVETVSRTLTSLRLRRIIQFKGARRVRILDRGALEWCSEHHESRAASFIFITSRERIHDSAPH